jgi:hypothetical protein
MEAEKWKREEGVRYVFHYTEAAAARQIAADANFFVGGGALFGPGLYATDLAPDEASEDEIRTVCFEGDGASIAYSGVLVLLADDPLTPFEEVDRRVFLLADWESRGFIPLHPILVGVGERLESEKWEIETWP